MEPSLKIGTLVLCFFACACVRQEVKLTDPFLALATYVFLIEKFEWKTLQAVLRAYENRADSPRTEMGLLKMLYIFILIAFTEKIDCWVETYSVTSGVNLAPFFLKWSLPVSEGVQQKLSLLPDINLDEFGFWQYL